MSHHVGPGIMFTERGWPWALLLLLCLCIPSQAKENTDASKNSDFLKISGEEEYDLVPFFTHLEDIEGKWSFEDISTPEVEKLFSKNLNEHLNFSVGNSTHWLRAEIRHIDKKHRYNPVQEWFLDVRRAQLDVAELYIKRANGDVQRMKSDLQIPFSERPIRNVNSVFPLTTERDETLTIYLKIKNKTATFLPIHLRTAPNFIRTDMSYDLLYGLFFGGMVVMIIYNLFILIAVRDITYFYYVAYLVPATLFEFIDIGHGIPLFEAFPYLLQKEMILLYIWMTFLFGFMFTSQYLDIERRSPLIYGIFKPMYIFVGIAALVSYLIAYDTALLFTAHFCSFSTILVVALGLYYWRKHDDTNAALLAGAWAFCVLGYITYGGLTTGWLSPSPLTIASLPLGTLLEAATLAFALGERIKRTQNQLLFARQRAILYLNRFRSFFDNATEGIYQLSLDGRIVGANNAMARILGYPSQSSLLKAERKATAQLFKDRRRPWRMLLGNREIRDEIALHDDTGTVRYAIHSAKLIRDASDVPTHIEGTLIDLTDRRQNEQAQRSRLKARHEKELAKSATDTKSFFLKDMSYRIRTPLTAIIGYGESLLEPDLPQSSRQLAVASVIRNSQILLQLVNDILDFSKIEAGKMGIESIDIDLMALIRHIQQQFEAQAKERNLTFRLDCRFPLPARIISDPTRIKQILSNLCSNAIRHTQSGTIKLTVRWDGIQQQICFDVEDSGVGMSADTLALLSREMLSLSAQNTSLNGGLGLAISHQLTQLLGGRLQIESRMGYGSRFTASIALRESRRTEWIKSAQPITQNATASNAIPQLNGDVLLAEDNPVNQKLIARLISKTGASVTLAENGRLALEYARAKHFDLILMDINMPEMDGLTATRTLRESGFTVPIHALTAEHGAEEIQACLQAGCNGHLTKPIDIPSFYTTLARHLRPSHASPPTQVQQ